MVEDTKILPLRGLPRDLAQKRQQKKTTTAPSKHTIKKQGRKQIEKICLSPTFKANSDRQIP